MGDPVSEWMHERTNEWMNEWMNSEEVPDWCVDWPKWCRGRRRPMVTGGRARCNWTPPLRTSDSHFLSEQKRVNHCVSWSLLLVRSHSNVSVQPRSNKAFVQTHSANSSAIVFITATSQRIRWRWNESVVSFKSRKSNSANSLRWSAVTWQ